MPRRRQDGTVAATVRRKLTDNYVRKMPARDRPQLVWDARQPCLAVLLQPRPSEHRAWQVVYRFHNRPRWFTIGDARKISVDDARKTATSVMAKVASEVDPAAEKRAQRMGNTWEELRTAFVEQYAKERNKSWE